MNDTSPAGRGSRRRPGRDAAQTVRDAAAARQFAAELDLRDRLAAIVVELAGLDCDTDVPATLAAALLEDLERELAAPADRREP